MCRNCNLIKTNRYNLVAATVIAGMFALINYKLKMLQNQRVAAPAGDFDDEDEEDI